MSSMAEGNKRSILYLVAIVALVLLTSIVTLPTQAGPPFCGDGYCNGGEYCDGTSFCKSNDCPTGYEPVCDANCGGYSCQPISSECGNGVLETGEECDGTDFGGLTCSDYGCNGGSLLCTQSCTIDNSGCTDCGSSGSGQVELLFTVRTDDVSESNISTPEQRLLDLIDNETTAIKASIDGLDRSNVVDRLIAAHNRGVLVQVTADCQIVVADANSYYQQLVAAGIQVVDDNNTFDGPTVNPGCTSTQTSGFVHNKFLIFEGQQTVWTGSTNLTDFAFNSSQNAILIISGNSAVVDFYEAEFNEMFGNGLSLRDGGSGQFGRQKDLHPGVGSFTLADGTVIEIAFSPYNYTTTSDTESQMNAAIDSAASEMLWTTYFLTYDSVRDRLDTNSAASKRGIVDPRTTDDYDDTQILINNGEQVLVTNFLGSNHWKLVIADPDDGSGQMLVGSHNFSNSSFNYNNENSVRILSPTLAQQARTEFDVVWNDPQNVGLVGCIHPGESYNENSLSLHRCNDGYDNDYDGLTDSQDDSCAGPFVCNACAAVDQPCTDNSDCCSNNCGGPPGGKTCKP